MDETRAELTALAAIFVNAHLSAQVSRRADAAFAIEPGANSHSVFMFARSAAAQELQGFLDQLPSRSKHLGLISELERAVAAWAESPPDDDRPIAPVIQLFPRGDGDE